ncbi:AsmA family protein [Halioxenophilus sp. WMMB6]|uniref:AsmA family protein n=1 Tax=Halioxenophilus sp. WMMB6 TaxID=3073815 RepID=UPI00295EABCD|nr:AsmA family protein [Halioxenophilus sp. WMMB6]
MKRIIKWVIAIALAAVVVLIAAVVVITLVIDPNDYKGEIEKLATEQGYPIKLEGDLSWRLYPNLGLNIGPSQLLNADGSGQFASVENVTVSVALLPLLAKQVMIDEIALDGVTANLLVDAEGNRNWQYLIKAESGGDTPDTAPAEASSSPISLAADSIRLSNAEIHYVDQQQKQELHLAPLNLEVSNLSLTGKPFAVKLAWTLSASDASLAYPIESSGELQLDVALSEDFDSVSAHAGKLQATLGIGRQVTPIELDFDVDASHLNSEPNLAGRIELAPTHVKNLLNALSSSGLRTQAEDALSQVGLKAEFSGNQNDFNLASFNLALDGSQFSGSARAQNLNQFHLTLKGGSLNIDHYLPEAAPFESTPPAPTSAADLEVESESDLLALLNDYQAEVNISLAELTASGVTLVRPTLVAHLKDGQLQLQPLSAELNGKTLSVTGSVNAEGNIDANVNVPALNLRKLLADLKVELPEMADPTTLSQVGLSLAAKGNQDDLRISNLALQLDQTKITGTARVTGLNYASLALQGDQLDLDRYLPPPAPEAAASSSPEASSGELSSEPIDFSALNDYGGDLTVEFGQLKANNLELANVVLKANSKSGLATLQQLQADFYQGKISAQGQLDTTGKEPKAHLTGQGQGLAIKPLLAALSAPDSSQGFVLSGLANGKLSFDSHGASAASLYHNAAANISADTSALQLAPINIEKYVCQAVGLIQGQVPSAIDWPAATEMHNLQAQINYANQVATIKTLTAGVEQFKLLANGKIDLGAETLDVRLPFTITQPLTQQPGCPATSDWIVGKALSLIRCKGNLLEPQKACGLDDRAVREAVKDYAEAKLKAEHQEELDRLDQKKEELKDKADDLLRDLLGPKKGKD